MSDRKPRDGSPGVPEFEQTFKQVVELTSDVITVLDETGTIKYVSPSVEEVLGYSPEEQIGDTVFKYLHPDDTEEVLERFQTAIEQSTSTRETAEFRFRHKDGSWVWLESIGKPKFADAMGGYILSSRDITERIERKRELRKFETIVEHSADFTLILDGNFNVDFVSPAVTDIIGFEEEEILNENAFQFVHPEDLDRTTQALQIALENPGETVSVEYRARHADGGWTWIEGRGCSYFDDPFIEGFMIDNRDISQRKAFEAERERMQRRADALFDELGEPVVEVSFEDDRAIIHRMNDTFEATFGLDESDIGTRLDAKIAPQSVLDEARSINEMVSSGDVVEEEVSRETSGGIRTFLLRTVPFTIEDEPRAYAIYIDITERKEREHELARQNQRLERVTRVISHDLRNPLTVAMGYLDIARERDDSTELARVEEAHTRMNKLIEDTLTLARHGDQVLEYTPVSLASIVNDCWSMVETEDASIELVTDATFMADPDSLPNLFENLFRNAVQHGGDDVTIRVGTIHTMGVFVEDDGPGIDESDPAKIFEPGHSTSSDGTGFGLAIVKEIVDAHGWDIEVTTAETGGARFEITGIRFTE